MSAVKFERRRTYDLCAGASAAWFAASTVNPGTLPTTAIRSPPAALLEAKTIFLGEPKVFRLPVEDRTALMQVGRAPAQSFAHVGTGPWMAPGSGRSPSHGRDPPQDFGEGAAEIDEESEGIHVGRVHEIV